MDIFHEILGKMYEFGKQYYGKHPNWLYINYEHLWRLRASHNFNIYIEFGTMGEIKTILGMQYVIKKDQEEIEVQ